MKVPHSYQLPAALLVTFAFGPSHVIAERLAAAPSVTLELCGDVDVDEVSSALAIEYDGEDFRRTKVTVACEGESARVRVLGPSHPRGRIADIDLTGVDEVAKPRTIALLAAEIWSAPEAAAHVSRERPSDDMPAPAKDPPIRGYRSSLSAGLGLLSANRDTFAGRETGSYGYSDELSMVTFKVDWPLWSRLGFFASYGKGSSLNLDTGEAPGIGMHWQRSEYGFYVPVWRERFRLDLRFSGGTDELIAVGNVMAIDRNVLLPDYEVSTMGVDLAYALNEELSLLGWAGSYGASMWDQDYESPVGARVGVGLVYDFREHLRLDLRAESLNLRQRKLSTGRSYSDDLTTLEVGLSIVR